MKKSGFTLLELVVVILIFVCLFFHSVVLTLLFGWIFFPSQIASELAFSPRYIIWAVVLFVAAMVIAHVMLARFYAEMPPGQMKEEPHWRVTWTIRTVATVLFLLTASVSLVGTVCLTCRTFASKEPLFINWREAARRSQSSNNLKSIGLGVHNYHDTFKSFPAGCTFNDSGEAQHGWMTALLGYMEHGDIISVNLDLPWDHPDQGDTFTMRIPIFLNPSFDTEKDSAGYALSHYAANSRVMGGREPLGFRDITDGTSNTLLSGEVNHDFKPWGHPINWRDPANGINQPGGFGSARFFRGCQFCLVDGSVRFISQDIDPSVLRALATPDGGENVDSWDRH